MHEEGRFKRLGLSNFSAAEVATVCDLTAARGWVRPSVYQGLYNALSRGVEADLMPVLRDNDMSFYAYNPLAGGLLTGKHSGLASLTSTDGRFKDNAFYFDRYGKEELKDCMCGLCRGDMGGAVEVS